MWPPIETLSPGNRNGKARLMRIVGPSPDCIGSTPRARRNTTPAPISPNTAPEAPTVYVSGLDSRIAPKAPVSSEAK